MEEEKKPGTAPILRLVADGGLQSKTLAHPLMTPNSPSVLGPPVFNNLQTCVSEETHMAALLRLFSLTRSTEALCTANLSSGASSHGPPGSDTVVTQAPVGIVSLADILRVGLSIGAWSLQLGAGHGSPPGSPLRFKDLKKKPEKRTAAPSSPARRAFAAIGATFRSFTSSKSKQHRPESPTPASAVLSAFTVSQVLASAPSCPIASLAADSPLHMLLAMFHKLAPPSHRATQTVFLLQETPPFHLSSAISSRDMARFLSDNVELLGPSIADAYVDPTYEPAVDPADLESPSGGGAPLLPLLLDPMPPGGGSPLPPPGTLHPSASPPRSSKKPFSSTSLLQDVVSASYTLPARDVLRLLHLHQVPAVALINEWGELVMQLSIRHLLVLATVDEDEAERLMGLPAHAFVTYTRSRSTASAPGSSSAASTPLLSEDLPDDRDVLPISVTYRAALAKFSTSKWDHLFLVDQESKPVKSLTVGALVHRVATELHEDQEIEAMRREVLGSSDDEEEEEEEKDGPDGDKLHPTLGVTEPAGGGGGHDEEVVAAEQVEQVELSAPTPAGGEDTHECDDGVTTLVPEASLSIKPVLMASEVSSALPPPLTPEDGPPLPTLAGPLAPAGRPPLTLDLDDRNDADSVDDAEVEVEVEVEVDDEDDEDDEDGIAGSPNLDPLDDSGLSGPPLPCLDLEEPVIVLTGMNHDDSDQDDEPLSGDDNAEDESPLPDMVPLLEATSDEAITVTEEELHSHESFNAEADGTTAAVASSPIPTEEPMAVTDADAEAEAVTETAAEAVTETVVEAEAAVEAEAEAEAASSPVPTEEPVTEEPVTAAEAEAVPEPEPEPVEVGEVSADAPATATADTSNEEEDNEDDHRDVDGDSHDANVNALFFGDEPNVDDDELDSDESEYEYQY